MKEVKIFLFGIGGYGSFYVNALSDWKDKDVVVEGICELMPGMEERFPIIRERQIPIYKSPEEFYARHQADLAIISTPIHLHHPHVRACIAHSNVLVEKPVCAALSEAEDMLRWEQETGHFVAVGYQLNYDRSLNALKRDILSGKLGKPVCMKALQAFKRGYNYYHRNNWAGKRMVDGCPVNDSPVNNSSAHQFQNMLFLLGNAMDCAAEVKAVEAELYRAGSYVENFDTAALKVTTAEDVPVYYYTTHNMKADQWGPMSEFCFETRWYIWERITARVPLWIMWLSGRTGRCMITAPFLRHGTCRSWRTPLNAPEMAAIRSVRCRRPCPTCGRSFGCLRCRSARSAKRR